MEVCTRYICMHSLDVLRRLGLHSTWFLGFDIGKTISLLTSRHFRVSKENCYLPENIQKVRIRCLQIWGTCRCSKKRFFLYVFLDVYQYSQPTFYLRPSHHYFDCGFSFLKPFIVLCIKHFIH